MESTWLDTYLAIKRAGKSYHSNYVRKAKPPLSWEQSQEIRRLYATGKYSYRELGEKYSLSHSGIESIVKYRTHKKEPTV